MTSRLSNALWLLGDTATRATRAGANESGPAWPESKILSPFLTRVVAVGLCVLIAWCIWRSVRPTKLRLRCVPRRPNRLTPLHVLILFIGYLIVLRLLETLLPYLLDRNTGQFDVALTFGGHIVLLVGGLGVAAFTFSLGLRRGLGLTTRHWLYDVVRGLLGFLAVIPVCMFLLLVATSILPDAAERPHRMLVILPALPTAWKVLAITAAVVCAPLSEEIFFRGLLQSLIRRYVDGPWPAILVSSAAFAAVHWATPQAVPALFALAVVIGYNYEHTGRLFGPILIHAIFNAVMVIDRFVAA